MDELLAGLKATAEITRLRILFALSHGEMNVTELTQVLEQSQPRVSRHLKLMADSGLISRHKEGNWVLFRLREEGRGGALARALVDMLPAHDKVLVEDLGRLETIRTQRQKQASTYFAANAAQWQKLRSLHVQEQAVEDTLLSMLGSATYDLVLDLGTGTGRILELLSGRSATAWGIDQSRIVPKAAFEYVRAATGSLQEIGGLDPVMASGATAERARVLIGVEIGRYWIFDQKIFDLSAYGKFVDNVAQNFGAVTVSLGTQSIVVQGFGESRYGADAGASASLSLSNTARLYINYDGKYRAAMQSHQGTLGVELKW